jgi:hypothetical protein
MKRYLVILFKNKKKKKILNKFVSFDRAKSYYKSIIKKSEEVIFDVNYENGNASIYEVGIVEIGSVGDFPVYVTDSMGRNIKVKLDEDNMYLKEISMYRKEELIFDVDKNKKIKIDYFIKKYLIKDTLKVVSILNNKIIVQKDEDIKLFSVKNEIDASRFIECLSDYFFKNKRNDCLFVKDTSTPQRKYLFELLEKNGFDKKILYRKFTTHPRQE